MNFENVSSDDSLDEVLRDYKVDSSVRAQKKSNPTLKSLVKFTMSKTNMSQLKFNKSINKGFRENIMKSFDRRNIDTNLDISNTIREVVRARKTKNSKTKSTNKINILSKTRKISKKFTNVNKIK